MSAKTVEELEKNATGGIEAVQRRCCRAMSARGCRGAAPYRSRTNRAHGGRRRQSSGFSIRTRGIFGSLAVGIAASRLTSTRLRAGAAPPENFKNSRVRIASARAAATAFVDRQ